LDATGEATSRNDWVNPVTSRRIIGAWHGEPVVGDICHDQREIRNRLRGSAEDDLVTVLIIVKIVWFRFHKNEGFTIPWPFCNLTVTISS
jgi:hypothetical protein